MLHEYIYIICFRTLALNLTIVPMLLDSMMRVNGQGDFKGRPHEVV